MAREKINWKVEENDVKEITEPLNIEIPIDRWQYSYIFQKNKIKNKKGEEILVSDFIKSIERDTVNGLYKGTEYNAYKRILYSKLSLSFIPDFKNKNWIIGYSPVEMINSIFETLNINERLDYIDYSNEKEIKKVKAKTELILKKEKLKLMKDDANRNKVWFINDTISNIDNIFKYNGFNIESKIHDKITYKNLLYYLSVKSLDRLDETDKIEYALIPRVYYQEVSSIGRAEWPNQLFMGTGVYSYTGSTFNERYVEVLLRYPILFEQTLGIKEINVMDKLEIVEADNFIDDVETTYNGYIDKIKTKKDYSKTEKELNDMLNDKVAFYRELLNKTNEKGEKVVIAPIKGKIELKGYYGFILNNNYIVLDKFFNKNETTGKVKPSCDEAIYSMPLDLFVSLGGSKKQMMDYIKNNPKGNVKRNYHTKKYSYRDNILNITKKDDVSTMKNDWFLSIYTPKKLVLSK